jgi:hypothetical protein
VASGDEGVGGGATSRPAKGIDSGIDPDLGF